MEPVENAIRPSVEALRTMLTFASCALFDELGRVRVDPERAAELRNKIGRLTAEIRKAEKEGASERANATRPH